MYFSGPKCRSTLRAIASIPSSGTAWTVLSTQSPLRLAMTCGLVAESSSLVGPYPPLQRPYLPLSPAGIQNESPISLPHYGICRTKALSSILKINVLERMPFLPSSFCSTRLQHHLSLFPRCTASPGESATRFDLFVSCFDGLEFVHRSARVDVCISWRARVRVKRFGLDCYHNKTVAVEAVHRTFRER